MGGLSVFADQSLDGSRHCGTQNLAASQVSFSLLRLLAEIVAVIGMENLNLAGSGDGISLCGRFVCLYFSHFFNILSVWYD